MPDNQNRLSKFWQELKRRNVIRVITVYAGAAFVIIELINNITEPLHLPEWIPTLVIIILLIGFPLAVIFSWIFDIIPEKGIVKTEPADQVEAEAVRRSSYSWKIASYISFMVILGMGGVLIYPKIFKPDSLRKLRDEKGVISLAVLPFDNLTGDSSLYYWQNGISEYLINRLANSQELAVSSSQVVLDVLGTTRQVSAASISPDIARETAVKIDASTYITGNFIGKENDASIMLNLVNTENGELIWTTSVDGDLESNYRAVLGHLSDTIRNYMEIKALEDQAEPDLISAFPNSAEAYRNYIDGLSAFVTSDYESAIESLETAYQIDTTFTLAALYLAVAHNMGPFDVITSVRWIKRAYELKNNLPKIYRPWIELWYAVWVTKDVIQVRKNADILYEADLQNRFLWSDVASYYGGWLDDYPKAISAWEKIEALNEKWEDDWKYIEYYSFYATDLLMVDRPEKAIRIANIGLKVNPSNAPQNARLVLLIGAADIMRGDSINAQIQKKELQKRVEEYNMPEAEFTYYIGEMHRLAKDTIGAVGYYRQAFEMDRGWVPSLYRLIECQLRTNMNLEECHELTEYGLKVHPDEILFLRLKGLYLHKVGEHQQALEILKEVKDKMITYAPKLEEDIQEVERSLNLKSGS